MCWFALDLSPIGLRYFEARIGEALLEPTVIGEQYEAFRVTIQSPDRIDIALRDVVSQRRPPGGIGELRQHVERFVEGDKRHGLVG